MCLCTCGPPACLLWKGVCLVSPIVFKPDYLAFFAVGLSCVSPRAFRGWPSFRCVARGHCVLLRGSPFHLVGGSCAAEECFGLTWSYWSIFVSVACFWLFFFFGSPQPTKLNFKPFFFSNIFPSFTTYYFYYCFAQDSFYYNSFSQTRRLIRNLLTIHAVQHPPLPFRVVSPSHCERRPCFEWQEPFGWVGMCH